jgi:hypothetical protein
LISAPRSIPLITAFSSRDLKLVLEFQQLSYHGSLLTLQIDSSQSALEVILLLFLFVIQAFPKDLFLVQFSSTFIHHHSLPFALPLGFLSNNTLMTLNFSLLYLLPVHLSNFQNSLCLSSLQYWFSHNGLALNADRSEPILFGTRPRSHSYRAVSSVNVADATVPLTNHVKLLGVTLDSHLTFDKHVNLLSKTCFYHIRAFRHIRPAINTNLAKLVACALVGSRLDYCNSALYGASKHNIRRLQRIQNSVARVVVGSTTYSSSGATATLRRLHWLPIEWRIQHKIATLAFKARSAAAPHYLCDLISVSVHAPPRLLHSYVPSLLTVLF